MWPAQTFGLPGQPSIIPGTATGSKDTISMVVQHAEDATATSFVLGVYDLGGTAVPSYAAPLLSVGSLDTSTKQQRVVFGTDPSNRGGMYRFTVSKGGRCHGLADVHGLCCLCRKECLRTASPVADVVPMQICFR